MIKIKKIFKKCVVLLPLYGLFGNVSCSTSNIQVDNFELSEGITYSGEMKDNLPNGKGVIKYENGDTLESSFINGDIINDAESKYYFYKDESTFVGIGKIDDLYSFEMIEGKLSYKNKRSYTGKFKNNLFNDDSAVFDFGTNTRYEGPFIDGSNVGLIGTIYYPTSVMNGEGVHYFTGEMASLGKFKPDQNGQGKIKFGDLSIYEGGIYFKQGNEFYRCGEGVQDFENCSFNASIVGGPSNQLLSKYVGEFDYKVTERIYGNGVMYFTDYSLKPTSYIKGFFNGLKKTGEPTKDITLLKEYEDLKESEWWPENKRMDEYIEKYKNKTPDIVFCGDSYMDMWQSSFGIANFEEDTKNYNCINTGIGGTIGNEWLVLDDKLINDFKPKQVVIHLGFNDTHFGLTSDQVINTFKELINSIKANNESVKIYFLGVEPSPNFNRYFDKESELNEKIKDLSKTISNIFYIDTPSLFIKDNKPIDNLKDYFSQDMVHLNKLGYELWWGKIKESI